ncbi:hypothetical protein [Photobacterium kagoshimensis]|uniref:hypothetical protein n=1 Tax=Photobacterium kagoshimensis TaxID=2910242 RepID=UPI003D0DF17D
MTYDLHQLVDRITSINRAWKVAQQDPNTAINSVIAKRLQFQKANWQLELLRSFPDKVWLKPDLDCESNELVYSVRFGDNIVITSDGDEKWNAEHLPARLAKELLTEQELLHAIQPKF